MSETNSHPWSHDPARDAAARREEPVRETIMHRELPEALAALTKRVEMMEHHFADASKMVSVTPPREAEPDSRRAIVHIDTDDTIDERVWDERGNEDGAMADAVSGTAGDPGTPVENRASPGGGAAERSGGRGAAVNADGLRTERVTLEVTHVDRRHVSALDWPYMVANYFHNIGESVRVVEDAAEITRLTAERDAAIRERDAARAVCERLRAAQLTSALTGDRFAQAVTEAETVHAENRRLHREAEELRQQVETARLEANRQGTLYSSQPPRGWLTKEDCEALYLARAVLDGVFVGTWQEKFDAARRLASIRQRAIREAGGEVAE